MAIPNNLAENYIKWLLLVPREPRQAKGPAGAAGSFHKSPPDRQDKYNLMQKTHGQILLKMTRHPFMLLFTQNPKLFHIQFLKSRTRLSGSLIDKLQKTALRDPRAPLYRILKSYRQNYSRGLGQDECARDPRRFGLDEGKHSTDFHYRLSEPPGLEELPPMSIVVDYVILQHCSCSVTVVRKNNVGTPFSTRGDRVGVRLSLRYLTRGPEFQLGASCS